MAEARVRFATSWRRFVVSKRGLAVMSLVLVLGACGSPSHAGVLSPNGFQQDAYGYRIGVAEDGRLMPKGWKLDNYYRKHDGQTSALTLKKTPEYRTTLAFDYDGDGKLDGQRKAFLEELRWVHGRTQAVVWVRSVPVSRSLRHVDLDVLVANYVDEASGAGYESIAFGSQAGSVEHRYVAKLLSQRVGTLAGQEAIDAELEIANSEQLKLDPNARREKVRLILARGPSDDVESWGQKEYKFPVVVVLGYANGPEHYAEGAPDFEGLLSRFEIAGRRGFVPTAGASATQTPPGPASVAAPMPAPPPPSAPDAGTPSPADPTAAPKPGDPATAD